MAVRLQAVVWSLFIYGVLWESFLSSTLVIITYTIENVIFRDYRITKLSYLHGTKVVDRAELLFWPHMPGERGVAIMVDKRKGGQA
ncbi:hypothetical protein GCM10010917_39580 [Paenibacillus physcomitrellae]|uniref:Uncharacterized protein n=1 Tax=Paenibacillus physcomitrellae TaxID=1619311 RepID=A0ABQ1GU05_9BACL|nr:hypothetical protein GCM10010917_39580 [Paenibacillus physcomitrellae]